jgi:Ca2+-binding RTX toxin-like protein
MYTSALKPFAFNSTDLDFLLAQIKFKALFDINGNAIINWNGTGAIYDGQHHLLATGPANLNSNANRNAANALISTWGTSYETATDLSGLRDPSGLNNNLALVNSAYGAVDQIFPRMAAADYAHYSTIFSGTSGNYSADAFAAKEIYWGKYSDGSATDGTETGTFNINGTLNTNYAITVGGAQTTTDGTAVTILNVVDYTPRMISLTTTTAGVEYDTWANHSGAPGSASHSPNEIYYDANGVASVLTWGNLATSGEDPDNGLGQVDTQARLSTSAGLGDHFIGGLNPGVSPSNGFFVLFGQFFDHGLDFIDKGGQGKTVKITLSAADPLYGMNGPDGNPVHEITINRATVNSVDANGAEYVNHTSPFIDQSQTYGSHEQLTTLLREWIVDPSTGQYHAGMKLLDGHTLAHQWQLSDGTMTDQTLPTLNELRAHLEATGRGGVNALTWEDVNNLRNRDASGSVVAGTSGSALILDSNPRFDDVHLLNGNATQDTALNAAVAWLSNPANGALRPGDSFGWAPDASNPGHMVLTATFGTALGPMPAGTYHGANALALWVNFSNFSINAPDDADAAINDVHDAVSEILMASVGDHYIAGDGRVNENFGLTSIHHIFHEEHNFQVGNLMDAIYREDTASGDATHAKLHDFQVASKYQIGNTASAIVVNLNPANIHAVAAVGDVHIYSTTGTHASLGYVAGGAYTAGTDARGNYINGTGQVTWDLDKMFNASKLVVEMEYQHAAVDQYARNVTPNIQEFVGYSPDKDPSVTLEYAQAAFRFGHSTLRETIDTIDPSGGLTGKIMGYALRDAFLNPDKYVDLGPAAILLGMSHQQMNEVDEFITPALNQGLLGQPLDLAAINIARGRDLGIPTLNDFREAIGLSRYTSWTDFGQNMQHPSSLVNFIAAYSFDGDLAKAQGLITDAAAGDANALAFLDGGDLGFNKIDTWLGGLAEIHQPGGLLGETFDLVFVTQIESLMDGDRFYYLFRLAGQQFAEEVGGGQLKDIVERNTGLTHLNGNIFGYSDKYYDLGAKKEVVALGAEALTTSNNHKWGDQIEAWQLAHPTYTASEYLAWQTAHPGWTAADKDSWVLNGYTAAELLAHAGDTPVQLAAWKAANPAHHQEIGVYSNGGTSEFQDGNIVTIGGVDYIRDTRMEDFGLDTGAALQNGGVNLDGTPNSGAESNEVIVATTGNDLIYAQGGDDTVYGEDGNDTIYGGYGIDRLYGGDGNDTLFGGDNPDLMDGGTGDDTIWGESSGSDINGADQLIGGSGNDFVSGGVGIDKLSGGTGDDHIVGDGDTDPFTHGSDGNDLVEGNSGGDILYGDNGDDVLLGGADQDQMFGGNGDDIIKPGDPTGALTIGTDEVLGGDGVTDINSDGTVGFDIISFDDNNARANGVTFDLSAQVNPVVTVTGTPTQVQSFQMEGVVGSVSGDTLTGDDGNNWIIGGAGADRMTGGAGNDIIIGGHMRLDDIIGKYESAPGVLSTYDHNNGNNGSTAELQLQDAFYDGASHRVGYTDALATSPLNAVNVPIAITNANAGLIDAANAQARYSSFNGDNTTVDKHFTELLRSDQFRDTVLGDSSTAADTTDTVVFSGNRNNYNIQRITYKDAGGVIRDGYKDHLGVVHANAFRITDVRNGSPDGSDIVVDVERFIFGNTTITLNASGSNLLTANPAMVSIDNATVVEGNAGTSVLNFVLTRTGSTAAAATVQYATSDGSATAGSDYVAIPNGSVTFAAGSATANIAVTVNGDTVNELNETMQVTLTNTGALGYNGTGIATGTITNDDRPSMSATSVTVSEGDSGYVLATVTISLSAPAVSPVTVNFTTANVTATAGTDYVANAGSVTFAPGETSATVGIQVLGELVPEGAETFAFNLSSANTSNATSSATVTILANDTAPTVSIGNTTVTEGVGAVAHFTVSLSSVSSQDVTVNYATADTTANSGSDYVATTGTATILAGQTSTDVAVNIVNDNVHEAATEVFAVNLTAPTNATLGNTQGIGIINDDDPLPSISVADVALVEGNSGTTNMVFTLSLSGPSSQAITVNYATANVTATAGSDYTAASGTAIFAPGSTSAQVVVAVNGDTQIEVNETLTLNLSAAANASIATASATGTISNDDFGAFNVIYGTVAGETISGTNGADLIYGAAGNDIIGGLQSDDMLFGESGDDVIRGGAGSDLIDGGAGSDTATYENSNGAVAVNLVTGLGRQTFEIVGTATETTVPTNGIDTLVSIENIRGSQYGDTLIGDANANVIAPGAGNDIVIGGGGSDTLDYSSATGNIWANLNQNWVHEYLAGDIVAGQVSLTATMLSNDVLTGMSNIIGSQFSDRIRLSDIANIVDTGAGDDLILSVMPTARDIVDGGAGTDTFQITGDASAETFNIYSKTAWLALGAGHTAAATSGIVITRNGTTDASVIAELANIEEIIVNGNAQAGSLTDGFTGLGATSGDTVNVIGNFVGTGLAYNTITVNGAGNTVDITGLTSDHRVVLNANGGTGSIIGDLRPQDVVNGALGAVTGTAIADVISAPIFTGLYSKQAELTLDDLSFLQGSTRNGGAEHISAFERPMEQFSLHLDWVQGDDMFHFNHHAPEHFLY